METRPMARTRRFLASGLLAGLTAGAGAGFLLEQSGTAGAAPAVVDDTTETSDGTGTGATSDSAGEGRRAPGERLAAILQPLVDDGTITQAQADAVIAAIDAARPLHGGEGHGHRGQGRRIHLGTVATALGMTIAELRDALADGSTLREVATAEGVDPQAVVDAIVAEVDARLAERVTAGEITQEEADAKLARVQARATALLDATPPFRRGRD